MLPTPATAISLLVVLRPEVLSRHDQALCPLRGRPLHHNLDGTIGQKALHGSFERFLVLPICAGLVG
jgi:hypothetical protein